MNAVLGFSLALSAGLIWSIGNIAHKVLVSRLIQSTPVMLLSLSAVSGLIGLALLPWFPLAPRVAWVGVGAAAACYLAAVFGYLSAMRTEDASRVVPLFGIGSVLIVLFSAVFLGEVFHVMQYIGIGAVLVGAILISVTGNWRGMLTGRLLRFMLISGTAFASHAVIMKSLLADYSYGTVFASVALTQALLGIVIAIVLRRRISQTVRQVSWKVLGLNIITDFFGFGAELLYTIALSVWYLALVETIASLQYLFIFFWGLLMTRWFPQVLREPMTRSTLIQKLIAVILIITGIYFIA